MGACENEMVYGPRSLLPFLSIALLKVIIIFMILREQEA